MTDYVPPGDWKGKKVNELQLQEELTAAGVTLLGVGLVKDEKGATVSVRIHLSAAPAAAAKKKIADVLTAHAAGPEANQPIGEARMEELRAKRRAGTKLTAAEQQELMDLLLGV